MVILSDTHYQVKKGRYVGTIRRRPNRNKRYFIEVLKNGIWWKQGTHVSGKMRLMTKSRAEQEKKRLQKVVPNIITRITKNGVK